jgi:hypothetical protein
MESVQRRFAGRPQSARASQPDEGGNGQSSPAATSGSGRSSIDEALDRPVEAV